jgi:O-succinylbenzoic acid--CoA ligase
MVSTQLYRLLNEGSFLKPENLQAILLGGSAMPHNILQKSLELGLPVYVSYGLTEMASQVATGRLESLEKGCAKVLPDRELKIDAKGEICVRGKTLFKGYWDGDAVRLPIDEAGWFHTGDLGRVDQEGCLEVLGRKDDMFISGGENIHPQEIESELLKIDSILSAVVVPKEDSEFGQRPVAFIRWEKDAAIHSDDALREILTKHLPKFKIPVAFYPWPSSPDGEGLKADRRYLMKLAKIRET